MKKGVKWTFLVLGSLVLIIVLAALVIPVIFKDDIKGAIDRALAKSVNADVVFDIDQFNITLFRNFPNLTVEMGELGVFNRAPFEGQVLFAAERFEVEVNLGDVLFSDQLRVKGISLIRPVINVKVLEDGRANYDIAIASEDSVVVEEESSGAFSFGIDHWEVVDADVTYDDRSMPVFLSVKGLNHSGSGDFSQDLFDLQTATIVDTLTLSYDGVEYMTNKRAEIDAVISIAEEYTLYTFKENKIQVNDFIVRCDGWFKMNESDYGMDITFDSPENTFKSLLSLVPGMYTDDFGTIEAGGELAFSGALKGTMSDNTMPAFNLNLLVKEAMFKYPDLPTPIEHINVDLLVDNKDGIIENTYVNLKKMHMDFGSNPVDAHAEIENLRNYKMDANVMARLNLAELNTMFPMEGLVMKGTYAIDLTAKGIYDSIKNQIPAIDAKMSLANGYIKSSEFPIPLQDMKFESFIKNTTGKMSDLYVAVNDFSMVMDGEKFDVSLIFQNLADYSWDLKANGGIDLEKMSKVFPVEGMALSGKVEANLATKGKYSDVEAERYDKLPTSGMATLANFKYESADLPYNVTMSQANLSFDPKQITLKNVQGTIGNSDFKVNGSVYQYMGYVMGKEVIQGEVVFNSTLLDLNEFMTETEEEVASTDTTSYGVVPVPEDIDFVLKSSIKEVRLMDYNISNAKGNIIVRDGIASLKGLTFNMLGGAFAVNGTYNTKDISNPRYDFDLGIQNVSIQKAATASTLISTYAPIAGLVKGNFSTDFEISGKLLSDMMPDVASVSGGGLIKIAQAALTESKLVSGVTSLTSLDNSNEVTLNDVAMKASIKDGRLNVEPFDVKFGSYKTQVSGSTGLDGSLAYSLSMNVPAGKVGTQVQSFVSQKTGSTNATDEIPVTIGVGGNYSDPKFTLIAEEQKEQAKEALTNAAKEETKKALQDVAAGTKAEGLVGNLFGNKTDSAASDSTKTKTVSKEEVEEKVKEEAKDKIKNLLKRK